MAWPFVKWKDFVWGVFSATKRGDADYHATKSSGWYLLPVRTLQLGWMWLEFLWTVRIKRKLQKSSIEAA
jgi:hypothetical protein